MLKVGWGQPLPGSTPWPGERIAEVARVWPGAMPGISVISNRGSVCHVDGKGQKEWYDLLAAAGTYTKCWFRFPDLGLRLKYLPRTVIALTGRILRHEVIEWKGGDRVCYAHWAKPEVLRALSIDFPSWVTQGELCRLLTPRPS